MIEGFLEGVVWFWLIFFEWWMFGGGIVSLFDWSRKYTNLHWTGVNETGLI